MFTWPLLSIQQIALHLLFSFQVCFSLSLFIFHFYFTLSLFIFHFYSLLFLPTKEKLIFTWPLLSIQLMSLHLLFSFQVCFSLSLFTFHFYFPLSLVTFSPNKRKTNIHLTIAVYPADLPAFAFHWRQRLDHHIHHHHRIMIQVSYLHGNQRLFLLFNLLQLGEYFQIVRFLFKRTIS